jgi:hypothetical protein
MPSTPRRFMSQSEYSGSIRKPNTPSWASAPAAVPVSSAVGVNVASPGVRPVSFLRGR